MRIPKKPDGGTGAEIHLRYLRDRNLDGDSFPIVVISPIGNVVPTTDVSCSGWSPAHPELCVLLAGRSVEENFDTFTGFFPSLPYTRLLSTRLISCLFLRNKLFRRRVFFLDDGSDFTEMTAGGDM
jgi:hypothetical protein